MLLMGKSNYFYGHVQVRKLLVYQRLNPPFSDHVISRVFGMTWLTMDNSQMYHLVMTNIAMERSTMLLSSVNHLFRLGPSNYHGEVLVITRPGIPIPWILNGLSPQNPGNPMEPPLIQ